MTFISLDSIVKNILNKRRYSLHFYLDFLLGAKDGLREISFDLPMNPIRYKILPLNSNHAIEIPADYQDWAGVYVRRDQYLIPLVEDKSLDLIPNYDSSFSIQPYNHGVATETVSQNQAAIYSGYLSAYWWMCNWDNLGENLGRQFGGIGAYSDTFRENRTMNEIKINENLSIDFAVLAYIGNGLDADCATKINSYAQNCIETYALWQFYLHNRTYSTSDEKVMEDRYLRERDVLRARIDDLTLDKLKRIVQASAIGVKY